VSVRPQLNVRSRTEVGAGSAGGGAPQRDPGVFLVGVCALAEYCIDDATRFGFVRRAGGVDDDASWRGGVQRAVEQTSLERHEGVEIVGTASPAGLRSPAQGAQSRAWHIGEHCIK
jgi:hypothetical protein